MPDPDLLSKVRKWLDQQGYPLEMRVAAEFEKAGFGVIQSEFYRDERTDKNREIDVVASVHGDLPSIFLRLSFVAECKEANDLGSYSRQNRSTFTIEQE